MRFRRFINQKIKINGEVDWIEERNGNTLLGISVPIPGESYQTESVSIYGIGSTSILKGTKIVVFGVVKGKDELQYQFTGATVRVPLIFATSISKI